MEETAAEQLRFEVEHSDIFVRGTMWQWKHAQPAATFIIESAVATMATTIAVNLHPVQFAFSISILRHPRYQSISSSFLVRG